MITFKFIYPKFPNVNNSKYKPKGARHTILTPEARKIKEQIHKEALLQSTKYGEIFSGFDPAKHYLEAEYMFYTPKLFTKNGLLSKGKPDWDGNIKYVQDACCKAMGIDDAYIINSTVKQFQSKSENEVYICIFRMCYLNSRFC